MSVDTKNTLNNNTVQPKTTTMNLLKMEVTWPFGEVKVNGMDSLGLGKWAQLLL